MGKTLDKQQIFKKGLETIHSVQGTGSGADLAASVFGGILAYNMTSGRITPVDGLFPVTVVYSGSKLPTTRVIEIVEEKYKKYPDLYDEIYDVMDKSVTHAMTAIREQDMKTLGEIFNINQGLMEAIGASSLLLTAINDALRKCEKIWGSKISGAGLGDCVVGVGSGAPNAFQVLPLAISEKGVTIE